MPSILLIVGAGGGFKQTLIGAGVGDSVAKFANNSGLAPVRHRAGLPRGRRPAARYRFGDGRHHYRRGIIAPLVGGLTSMHLALWRWRSERDRFSFPT